MSVLLAVLLLAPPAARVDAAMDMVPASRRDEVAFVLQNMPPQDRRTLTPELVAKDVLLACETFERAPWRDDVPRDVFLSGVLPYCSVSEKREDWRGPLRELCAPLVAHARTPGEAALILNRELFPLVKVKYSTERKRPDQSPSESMEQGKASCTGLSILLIDACRSVGVPARFVGVPAWPDDSGNHSWVEVWDGGAWHFVGAAEPADALDRAWFAERAASCVRDDPRHAIYAVSFERTPLPFPMAWDETADAIHAVNVTDRYAGAAEATPAGSEVLRVRVVRDGRRVAAGVRVLDAAGAGIAEGVSRDEGFDTNDHLSAVLPEGRRVVVEASLDGVTARRRLRVRRGMPVVTIPLPPPGRSSRGHVSRGE